MIGRRDHSPPHPPGPGDNPVEGDAELVALARQGDARAFAALYRRYVDRVHSYAAHRLESREAAEDATQTVFLRAIASLDTCRNGDRFAGWLFTIAHNVIVDAYRARRAPSVPIDEREDIEDHSPTPEMAALEATWVHELAQLRRDCLNAGDREILDLRMEGLNDREIADALKRSHGAIRTAQYRVVQKLRDCLGLGTHAREADHGMV